MHVTPPPSPSNNDNEFIDSPEFDDQRIKMRSGAQLEVRGDDEETHDGNRMHASSLLDAIKSVQLKKTATTDRRRSSASSSSSGSARRSSQEPVTEAPMSHEDALKQAIQ